MGRDCERSAETEVSARGRFNKERTVVTISKKKGEWGKIEGEGGGFVGSRDFGDQVAISSKTKT